jgi:hypothetical protein
MQEGIQAKKEDIAILLEGLSLCKREIQQRRGIAHMRAMRNRIQGKPAGSSVLLYRLRKRRSVDGTTEGSPMQALRQDFLCQARSREVAEVLWSCLPERVAKAEH